MHVDNGRRSNNYNVIIQYLYENTNVLHTQNRIFIIFTGQKARILQIKSDWKHYNEHVLHSWICYVSI